MTILLPAAPKDFLTRTSLMAAVASALVRQIRTPLPSARPSAFTAQCQPSDAAMSLAEFGWLVTHARAVGMPYRSMKICENAFDASNCADLRFGPQMRRPFA